MSPSRTLLHLVAIATLLGACSPALEAPVDSAELLDCTEVLFRPTSTGGTLHWVSRGEIEARVSWGSDPDKLEHTREFHCQGPTEFELEGLSSNSDVYCRLEVRPTARHEYSARPVRSFRTARDEGTPFRVGLIADSHFPTVRVHKALKHLRATVAHCVEDDLDFIVFLGDEAGIHFYGDTVKTMNAQVARDRWMAWRKEFTPLLERFPSYMALGNHEGEAGFYEAMQTPKGPLHLQSWGTAARKRFYLNPSHTTYPEGGEFDGWQDPLHSSDDGAFANSSPLQNYFAWTWGDALFVVIDVHRYTQGESLVIQAGNPSAEVRVGVDDWTLGAEQLAWLEKTLSESDAKHKLLFAHHLVGGWDYGLWGQDKEADYKYGRGGARYARRGEQDEITNLMNRHGARYFFYGHDHVFAHQAAESIEFVCCGRPSYLEPAWWSSPGWLEAYGPVTSVNAKDFLAAVGYTRLTVDGDKVAIEYVRTSTRMLKGENVPLSSGEVVYRWDNSMPSPTVDLLR